MTRFGVDDDQNNDSVRTAGTPDYVQGYGSFCEDDERTDRCIIVKINPEDVKVSSTVSVRSYGTTLGLSSSMRARWSIIWPQMTVLREEDHDAMMRSMRTELEDYMDEEESSDR